MSKLNLGINFNVVTFFGIFLLTTFCSSQKILAERVKARVIATNDGEIDDRSSMVRFLMYSNDYDNQLLYSPDDGAPALKSSQRIVFNITNENSSIVGLYRTFDKIIENDAPYSNKFNDVTLTCTYISPSGDSTGFMGFFDGDGNGGGNLNTGNVWRIRFMPDETGEWKYTWKWSDSTPGGEGTFICDSVNAGKGILQPYKENPYWLAYNGTEPVWLKSYYESGHGSIAQPLEWLTENVYQTLIDRGYNHFQVNWLLSLCCFNQYYNDGPAQSTTDLALYRNGKASTTMRLDVWQLIEQNIAWLNDKNIGLFMFLGLNGGRNKGPDWTALSESEKDFYIRYVVARLAPYANIAGWNYTWEVEGDTENGELGCMRLIQKYDVFNHLRTYHDEKPKYNEYHRPEYNFAGIENHRINSDKREPQYWSAPWTHHDACLMGYVPGKPVYMVEGNALWRRYWAEKIKKETGRYPTLDELRQSAWACATAGASFTWCGHQGEGSLVLRGPEGFPFFDDDNEYALSALQIDILTDVMNNEVAFYRMIPSDSLLSDHNNHEVWCLSEKGEQYLVFSSKGNNFKLKLSAGEYKSNQWKSALTGAGFEIAAFTASENEIIQFTPPDQKTDWILLIRKEREQTIKEETFIESAETDSTGAMIYVTFNKDITLPDGYQYGFKLFEKALLLKSLSINMISVDQEECNKIIIEPNDFIKYGKEISMSYGGTLRATDHSILAPVNSMKVKNNVKEKEAGNSIQFNRDDLIRIFPNPCDDYLEITGDKIRRIQVFNMRGDKVLNQNFPGNASVQLNIKAFHPGTYLISILSGDYIFTKSFVKEQ